jgi:hypothetical protein
MISGAPVLKVRVEGKITPTDLLVPSAKVMLWLTHLPSKYTLAWGLTLTFWNRGWVVEFIDAVHRYFELNRF